VPQNDQIAPTRQNKLSCAGCGKPGVGICAKCCKKPEYRLASFARANPLRKRAPELYRRLDDLSRLPLDGNRNLWDEFCVDIKAGDLYEHLPILVEMVQEGKWRTDALRPKEWLRAQFAGRVKRQRSKVHDRSGQDDYDLAGQRRASGPRFDKRNGALVECEARPYIESEITNGKGGTVSPEEVIDGLYARRELTRADGGHFVKSADREDLAFLKGMSLAERREAEHCKDMVVRLRFNRPAFDKALAESRAHLEPVIEQMKMGRDEAEVLAVEELLWAVGPRCYLKFLDEANYKRVRNAWDRLDRLRKKPAWAALFRRTLREFAKQTRKGWSRKYWADYDRQMARAGWRHLVPEDSNTMIWHVEDNRAPMNAKEAQIRREQMRMFAEEDERLGIMLPPLPPPAPEVGDDDGNVVLGWDIDDRKRALYRSSAKKPKPLILDGHRHRRHSDGATQNGGKGRTRGATRESSKASRIPPRPQWSVEQWLDTVRDRKRK
jgi:hypothetical protein